MHSTAQDQRRDMFCRRDAAARTGYVTPGEAASREQTNGSVGGTVTGAALGAIIGGASHAAGAGALIGAGAGLIAGTAIGSDNARHAASDVERAYGEAYQACMSEADDRDVCSAARTMRVWPAAAGLLRALSLSLLLPALLLWAAGFLRLPFRRWLPRLSRLPWWWITIGGFHR